ncbi:MAG: tRNA (guanosine(37)-N1)-methyltransferase TrmD, partial [Dehalococcoidia bacterium]|nr:tRNA (guanosine(37)-N1)-methyltransferase TrmD [Dehalococcoidia bacterium]
VPEILLSGNHSEIEKWRREQAINRTNKRRPELHNNADSCR